MDQSAKQKITNLIDVLLSKGEKLSDIRRQVVNTQYAVGIGTTYPADAVEYHEWDGNCHTLLRLLGNVGQPWAKILQGTSYGDSGERIRQKIGTLRAIKSAIDIGLLDDAPQQVAIPNVQPPAHPHTVQITGPVYGGLQVGTVGSSQSVKITLNSAFEGTLNRLRQAVLESDLDAFDKEDISHNLDRIHELSRREPDERMKASILDKLTAVEKTIRISEGLAKIALPMLLALQSHVNVPSTTSTPPNDRTAAAQVNRGQ